MDVIKNIRIFVSSSLGTDDFDLNLAIKAIQYRYPVFKNVSEIYDHNEYLPGPISLKSAIEFHCAMGGKQVNDFLKFFLLEDQVIKYENTILRDVPFDIKKLISVLLYLYLNKTCILQGFNLLTTFEQMNKNYQQRSIFNNYLKQQQLIYIQPENTNKNHYLNMHEFFNRYAIINDGGIRCFTSKEEYSAYLD